MTAYLSLPLHKGGLGVESSARFGRNALYHHLLQGLILSDDCLALPAQAVILTVSDAF